MGYFSLIAFLCAIVTLAQNPGHVSHPGGFESQGAPAVPCRVHSWPMTGTVGQDMLGHAAPVLLQLTSHWHDRAQSIDGHAPWPEQVMSHAASPQLMLPHAAWPEQSILQRRAAAQSMSPQLELLHRMVQSNPAGHFTAPQL
jgi:hypothetical protein